MAGQTPKLSLPSTDGIATRQMLTLLAVAGFSGVTTTRLCDAMLPALVQAFGINVPVMVMLTVLSALAGLAFAPMPYALVPSLVGLVGAAWVWRRPEA